MLYDLSFEVESDPDLDNPFGSRIMRSGFDLTIVSTSIMTIEALRAAEFLEKLGVSIEIIDLHSISHPNKNLIISSVTKTGRLLVIDTSWVEYGVAAEINRIINEHDPSILKARVINLGMKPTPCPTAKALEDLFYHDIHDIVVAVKEIINAPNRISEVPAKQSMTDFYKHFKGPF